MSGLHLRTVAIGFALLGALTTAPARAQARFELLTRDTIGEIGGLQIFTIRDNHLAACYTVFVLQPTALTPSPPSPELLNQGPSPTEQQQAAEERAKAAVLQRLRDAAAKRDQQFAELRARADDPLRIIEAIHTPAEFETARLKIEDEFAQALVRLLPGSPYAPYAAPYPGGRTSGDFDLAEAIRRSLANPDQTTLRTFADSGGSNAQLESLSQQVIQLQRMVEAPKLTASGPAPCNPSTTDKAVAPR